MSRKKISTTIYVTPEQDERLRLLHERTKVPVAVYIREGIDLVLRQYVHLLPGQLPLTAEARALPQAPQQTELESRVPASAPRPAAPRPERQERVTASEAPSEHASSAPSGKG
jgi:hypothetical protein